MKELGSFSVVNNFSGVKIFFLQVGEYTFIIFIKSELIPRLEFFNTELLRTGFLELFFPIERFAGLFLDSLSMLLNILLLLDLSCCRFTKSKRWHRSWYSKWTPYLSAGSLF